MSDRYMITISCQQKKSFISYQDLYMIIMWLKLSIPHFLILKDVFETSGRYHQLHYHALILVTHKFRYKPYTKYGDSALCKSYRIQWDLAYNLKGAISYLEKDLQNQTQEEILMYNYYSINRFNEPDLHSIDFINPFRR